MKKTYLWIGAALVAGLLAGYLIFGNGSGGAGEVHTHEEGQALATQWTCSMHPQILQPEPGDCPICGMDLIPVDQAGGTGAAGQVSLSENAIALADIQTTRVQAGAGEGRELVLSGTIRENEESNAVQSAYYGGRIERLLVTYPGEEIRQGQLLATLYAPELITAQQELLTAARVKQKQPALYEAVKRKLLSWKLDPGQIEGIEARGAVQEYFPIRAGLGGTVTEIMVEEGDYVERGAPLMKVANLGSVWAVFDAYENQISGLQKGQQVRIVPNAFPGQELEGRIDFIDPLMKVSSRTVTVRVSLANPGGRLKPGMFVRATVRTATGEGGLYIPETAVLWTGSRSVVYVKVPGTTPSFVLREVSLGPRSGPMYPVLEGLRAGEEIVSKGAFTVDAAAQLQGNTSMMNPGGGPSQTGHGDHGVIGGTLPDVPGGDPSGLPGTLPDGFGAVLEQYLAIKDALVASDPSKTSEAARALLPLLAVMDKDAGDSGSLEPLEEAVRALAAAGTLEEQRRAFQGFSRILIGGARVLASPSRPLYVQYCPMANQNQGAYWLSRDPEVRNPYYGDAMLTCGEVRETLTGS
ncbi:efflux RND transporter periplasmic adaptor subunit [Robiginitalea marina]|uniref:Efflux RND transporter periplasmic adaptor subunit n=1 Tax=Robiginitalea marina TaxID=2954105 RepID=A0ABT1B0I5_9FLAO|nr:efflux RND transporter periplasmic adaptor subunit [Robiginitalea marina]MCO5725382.1 efflux RND transporter periplasmic adaptor subunit [Robiginitalea marina]